MSLKLLFLSLFVVVVGACHTVAQQPQSSPSPPLAGLAATVKMPLAPSVSAADANSAVESAVPAVLDELMTALQAAQQAKSFRARLNTQINNEETDELALEIVAPDRRRIKGHNLEIIIIGEEGYLSFGNKWQKALRDPAAKTTVFKVAQAPVYWGKAENKAARGYITMKNVTPTTYEEQAATLYEYEMKDAFGKKGVCQLRTWVTKADGLPRKTEMSGAYEGRQSKATLTWLEYNAALAIEAPALP